MFNVTILKMKDIIKYIIGITITVTIVIFISKQFSKENNNEEKIVNEVKNGISMLSEQSFINCFEQAVPTMKNINEEYSKVAQEDDHSKEDLLQGILKTQISSIQEIENEQNLNNENNQEQNVEQNQIQEQTTNQTSRRSSRSRSENRSNNKYPNKRNI